ncbi:MAG: hypothetical protein KGJ07_09725 [Patescibacteria group bacterium]|nr:hypothetical protein [Patescibacteria group bacterium]MDE2588201.1 hypothetical protein [Patescibacteria group bacterium]
MRTDKEIIAQLHTLQSVVPSDKLRKRIVLVGKHLPQHLTRTSLFPIFRPAFALAVFLLFVVGVSSSVVLSANKSQPGSFLFPIKKAVIQTQIHFTQSPVEKQKLQEEILEITPTATPTPTPIVIPTKTPEKVQEKKDVKGVHVPDITVTMIPLPQGNSQYHGNSHWQRYISNQSFENYLNNQDDNSSDHFKLNNHEF